MASLSLLLTLAVAFYFLTESWRWHSNPHKERLFWVVFVATWCHHHGGLSIAQTVLLTLSVTALHDRLWLRIRRPHAYITQVARSLPRLYPEAEGRAVRLTDVITAANRLRGPTGGLKQLFDWLIGNTPHYQELIHGILMDADPAELNYALCCTDLPEILQYARRETEQLLCNPPRLETLTTPARAALVDALQKKGLTYDARRQRCVRDVFLATTGRELTLLKSLLDIRKEFHTLHKLVFTDLNLPSERAAVVAHIAAEALRSGRHAIKVVSDVDDTLLSSGGRWPAGVDGAYPRGAVYPGVLAFYRELDFGRFAHTAVAASTAEGEGTNVPPEVGDPDSPSHGAGATITRWTTDFVDRTLSSTRVYSGDPTSPYSPPSTGRSPLGVQSVSQALQYRTATFECGGHTQTLYRSCGLVFLSARPHIYQDYGGEHHFFKHVVNPLQTRSELHTFPALIPGALWHSLTPLFLTLTLRGGRKTWRSVGLTKLQKLVEFSDLYPECALVFLGDNGQGDLLAAEAASARLGVIPQVAAAAPAGDPEGRMLASFIHAVQPEMDGLTELSHMGPDREEEWRRRNIFHFKTYVGAALQAFGAGLISEKALRRVTSEAILDFRCLRARRTQGTRAKGARIDPATWGAWDWRAAERALQGDLEAVAARLGIPVPPLDAGWTPSPHDSEGPLLHSPHGPPTSSAPPPAAR